MDGGTGMVCAVAPPMPPMRTRDIRYAHIRIIVISFHGRMEVKANIVLRQECISALGELCVRAAAAKREATSTDRILCGLGRLNNVVFWHLEKYSLMG
ncbi:MAG: hypothetical protein ACRDE5_10865 [Ginsengibacter sp.]